MKIYVGDGVLDVPEGPGNEFLLRDIWQGFGTVKTVPYGCGGGLRHMARFLCAMNLKIIIKNAAARWGGGK